MRKLVYGVGVNDSSIAATRYDIVNGKKVTVWSCPFYQEWRGMMRRCYDAGLHIKHPTYIGCEVSKEWALFSAFKDWMQSQDWEGKHLDKDILRPGNKIYSPESCVFVSRNLNNFLTGRSSDRGRWPLGVCWNKELRKFQSNCRNPFNGKKEYLGLFPDPESAHQAWRNRKHELACQYADIQKDPRVAAALRQRFTETAQ